MQHEGRGREATGTESARSVGGEGPVWRGRVCVGHLWDILDPDVETLTCTERERRGKRRRTLLLLNCLITCSSRLQSVTTEGKTLRNSKGLSEQ